MIGLLSDNYALVVGFKRSSWQLNTYG